MTELTNLCSKYCPSKNGRCEEPLAKRDNKTGDVTAEPHCECEDKYVISNTGKIKSCVGMKLIFFCIKVLKFEI